MKNADILNKLKQKDKTDRMAGRQDRQAGQADRQTNRQAGQKDHTDKQNMIKINFLH
jgi:hypothetical protein